MSLKNPTTTTATATHAVVNTVESYIQNQNLLGEVAELDDVLCNVVDEHKDNEVALKHLLQCIYRLLHNHNRWNVKFGAKVFHKLIALLIVGGVAGDADRVQKRSRQLVANVLVCVQVHARKFPRHDGKFVLKQLWLLSQSREQQPHVAQILVQLFDDFEREMGMEFVCSVQLHTVIQQLLQSHLREERKSAYFIMRKLSYALVAADENDQYAMDTLKHWGWHSRKQFEQLWSCFITIFENLEEQQSHLVLPTLNTLLPRIVTSNQSDNWVDWLHILYKRLLCDNNNILVLRWILKYFLNNLNIIHQAKVLYEFMKATNNTQLYNVEAYCMPNLPREFCQLYDKTLCHQVFWETMASVNWRAVPLLHWLRTLEHCHPKIETNVLVKLCTCVRNLQNPLLRKSAQTLLRTIFQNTISFLSLKNYLFIIENLYNTNDGYDNYNDLLAVLNNCKNPKTEFVRLNKRCYDIIFDQNSQIELTKLEFNDTLLHLLKEVPKIQHGWWRFVFVFNYDCICSQEEIKPCLDFLHCEYDINISWMQTCTDLSQLQEYLVSKLICENKEEQSFVLERTVDLFVSANLQSGCQMKQLHLNPVDLLDRGSYRTFSKLCFLLKDLEEQNLLPSFISHLKKHYKGNNCDVAFILDCMDSNCDQEDYIKYVADILNLDLNNIELAATIVYRRPNLPNYLQIQGLLHGELTTGDARIEAAYAHCHFYEQYHKRESCCIRYIYSTLSSNNSNIENVLNELLRMNNDLTKKKPRYFENSKEHRTKIRIATAIYHLTNINANYWSDNFWTALLAPNDQLNISYMYECLVAHQVPCLTMIMERLKEMPKLKPSQQVSLISVAHIYCILNWQNLKSQDREDVFKMLLPLTMGAHFQTRRLAQLVIHRLAQECDNSREFLPIASSLKTAVESTFGDKLDEHQNEGRLLLPELLHASTCWKFNLLHLSNRPFNQNVASQILYMTNAPFDEFTQPDEFLNFELFTKLKAVRSIFSAKSSITNDNLNTLQIAPENENVQRKMNPISDIYPHNDLTLTIDVQTNKAELIVVASLIDKLPNLGGLARTCEVLGVSMLILDSKAYLEKSDFKNLSMTAEKNLNIMEVKPTALTEFLIEKQAEGYKVVGAEQTAKSKSFVDFKFPKKCILLLGHEKHGIPVDLIGHLDYAVEIPQFGMVRSLNVHVTGSLFIWEYCKQHFVEK